MHMRPSQRSARAAARAHVCGLLILTRVTVTSRLRLLFRWQLGTSRWLTRRLAGRTLYPALPWQCSDPMIAQLESCGPALPSGQCPTVCTAHCSSSGGHR
eukprot:753645-Hanusia_phi.AAC.1